MFGTPSLIYRRKNCTRWLKVKTTQWLSFEKCCTRVSLNSFMYVRVTQDRRHPLRMCHSRPRSWSCWSSWLLSAGPSCDDAFHSLFRTRRVLPQLSCSQLEIQKLQRAVRQKERQLADARRCVRFVEAAAQERERQKEASWKHNQVNH